MQLKKYPFVKTEETHYYEFDSKGPKGVIKKIVLYDNVDFQEIPIFNLSFGDGSAFSKDFDDAAITDNNDRKKVLSTVAATVLQFLRERPKGVIYAKGATAARNRLYRMGIGLIWDEIKGEMDIYGRLNRKWYRFTRRKNFDAFIMAHKSLHFNPNNKQIIR